MKNRIVAVLGVATVSLLLLGCSQKEGGGGGNAAGGSEILVGEFASMTGAEGTFGQSSDNGIKMALDEINAAGGVHGKKIRVMLEDDQSKPEEAASAVTKLISENNVIAILGEVASSNSLAAAPICQQNKVPMITPSSTNPKVTQIGDYIFRVCYIDPYQGEALANFVVNDLKAKRAAILRDVKSDYSMGLAEFFKRRFLELGGQIVTDRSYSKGDNDFSAPLTAIQAANPEIIFVPGYYTDIGQIARQARDLGMKQPLVGGDGWESPKLIEIGGPALEGCFYSTHYQADDPSPSVQKFVQKYEKLYHVRPDGLAALAYDAMYVLANAMKRASKLDGPTIRDEIAKTSSFPGVTGNITLGPDRNPVNKKLVVLEISGGQLKLKSVIDPARQGTATRTDTAAGATMTGTAPPSAATTTH